MNPFYVPIAFFFMTGAVAILLPLARAYARRLDKQGGTTSFPPEVTARLERMEQAIESIALEVERISEGQRFTTKLLSERVNALPPARGDA